MSIVSEKNAGKDDIPVCINSKTKQIFYLNNDDVFPNIDDICPFCEKHIIKKEHLIHHIKYNVCGQRRGKICKHFANIHSDDKLTLIPNEPSLHDTILVTGIPGCGKSFWVNEYIKNFAKLYPDYAIHIFTRNEHCNSLTYNKIYKHIINDMFRDEMNDLLTLDNFKKCLCIFDDIETSEHPDATKKLYAFMDDIIKNGRHYNCNVIFVNQESRMGMKTKTILSCVNKIVVFPRTMNEYQTSKLLEHIGVGKKQLGKIRALNSRTAVISNTYPAYVCAEHDFYLLGKECYFT